MFDLLDEPLLGVHQQGQIRHCSLPELLGALAAGTIDGYTGLRAHQADPWHVFLVQLAASVQARHPTPKLPTEASYWREGLLELAEGQQEAWQLIVSDTNKPAFLQHPWQEGDAKAYKPKASTPDALDVLITAKNHDVKMARIQPTAHEAWLYALVLLQTTSGFLGQGNYGSVRMNSGYSSRPMIAFSESLNPSARFVREVNKLTALRGKTCERHGYLDRGVVLTWLKPWTRQDHQYMLTELEPWFIEAVRAIRLKEDEGRILALGVTSKARQIGPKTQDNGDVGDPWIPIKSEDKKKGRAALTLGTEGFTPELLTRLLFRQGFELTALQQPQSGEGDGWFIASCLARGPGKTEGFHRLELPIPAKVRLRLLSPEHSTNLGKLAEDLLRAAKDIQACLGHAMTVLIKGGPQEVQKDDFKATENWRKTLSETFTKHWEANFFPTLWRAADEDPEQIQQDWQARLIAQGEALLFQASEHLPQPSNRTWRAHARSQTVWRGCLHKVGYRIRVSKEVQA